MYRGARFLPLCVIALLGINCGANGTPGGVVHERREASIRINARLVNGLLRFDFSDCASRTDTLVRSVVVADADGELCTLDVMEDTENQTLASWAYGTRVSGYQLGSCSSLEIGRRYQVSVAGAGDGIQVFQLNGRNELWLGKGVCPTLVQRHFRGARRAARPRTRGPGVAAQIDIARESKTDVVEIRGESPPYSARSHPRGSR